MESDLQTIKEEVRARTDICDIIGQYTRLKQAGKNWVGLCPFHNDKSPSFSVSKQYQSYRCWSCGEKGDLFTFVQKKENLEFIEALEWLAKRAGVPFERRGVSREQASEREQMLELNRLALRFFQDRLARSQEAKEYLTRRAILKPTQEQWDIGYAPPEWDALVDTLRQKRANLELAEQIGLIKARKHEGSGHYDVYRHRLIFPIHDLNGQIVGFGGRAMSSEEKAKYINSSDSPLFNKSKILYGLYFARKRLTEGQISPVFVEGYVDVIATHQAGFTQCVATLGTAMTEEHARMLARYSPRVIVCYDSDRAGIGATLRSATIWESMGVEQSEMRVARLPAGEDPDSLLKQPGGTQRFQEALDTAVPRIDFQIELILKRHPLETEEGKYAALAEAIPILASIPSLSLRSRYADRLVHLHPLYGRYGIERALQQILGDAETAAQQTRGGRSPRMQGYPLTSDANSAPLQEQPPPPLFRPPANDRWGEQWPHTRDVIRKGEGNGPGGGEKWSRGERRDRRRQGPASDPTPPSLTAPTLTRAEKAERQLLRALFSAEWRVHLLDQLKPERMITPFGERLLGLIARTPAQPDGSIDPLPLLLQARKEEDQAVTEGSEPPNGPEHAYSGRIFAKFSDFLSELLEETPYIPSKDLLNAATLGACILELQKDSNARKLRELKERMQQELSAEERRLLQEQYHLLMRSIRGSQPQQPTDRIETDRI